MPKSNTTVLLCIKKTIGKNTRRIFSQKQIGKPLFLFGVTENIRLIEHSLLAYHSVKREDAKTASSKGGAVFVQKEIW